MESENFFVPGDFKAEMMQPESHSTLRKLEIRKLKK
jgi:hypothetical protein